MQKLILIFSLFLFTSYGFSQTSYYHSSFEKDYIKAVNLYDENLYEAAKLSFERLLNNKSNRSEVGDIYFYLASIAVRTGDSDAEYLLEYFTQNFPTHPKRNLAYFDSADYYFTHSDLEKGQELINKVDPGDLSEKDYEKYNFYMAYSYLQKKKWKKAEKLFEKLLDSEKYGKLAKYYTGYIAYQRNDYAKAQKYFGQLTAKEYNKKLPYYKADMYFKLKRFQDAIDEANKIYDRTRGKDHSELAKIIGESYFNLKKYSEAIPYLQSYKGKKGKWNNVDYYQLGYAYYKNGDYQNAINYFNKIISGNDSVAQNAYYHLADSYLKTNQKLKALNAFKKVSEMSFDKKMQEDAFYNYAKLGYELGNPFENSSKVIQKYLKKYPKSLYKSELEELLVNSYLTSNNFENAIKILEKNKQTNSKTYQKAAYYRGLELLNEGDYAQAINMFDKVLKTGFDPKLRQLSKFWKAEANFRLHKYDEAKIGYEDFASTNDYTFLKEGKLVNYNLGYTYFKLKQYPKAAVYFQKFIQTKPNKKLLKDSYLRLGDSHFASKKYWPAMDAYNKAKTLQGADGDYAAYQKAISYGFVGKNNKKIDDLNLFIREFPNSKYMPDALYQLGSTYANKSKNTSAIQSFEKLLTKFPDSKYVPIVLLKEASIYYNTNQNGKALQKLKLIVQKFPNTPVAHQAVENIKNIYIDEGKANEYAQWAKTISWINVTDTELDDAVFESAQEKYMNLEQNADRELEKYLTQFPSGIHNLDAHYYLAKIYQKKNNKAKIYKHFSAIAQLPQNKYTIEAIRWLANYELQNDKAQKAIPHLERLEILSSSPNDLIFAQSNLMKAHYKQKNYNSAIEYAQKVLQNSKSSMQMKNDAKIIIARSSMETNDENKAKEFYTKVSKTATGKLAAESLYYVAYFQNKEGKFDASNKTIAKMTKKYARHKYWASKALVLMARNTYAKGDAFNATYILESVIKNFKQYPDVVNEADDLLKEIKAKEANKNSSVND